jgi:hypothetical protein
VSRTLILSLLVLGTAAALAFGAYSALADGGRVTSVAGAVIGADERDDGGDVEAADVDDVDAEDVDEDDGANGEGAQHVAQVVADEFGVSQEDVMALHEQGIGFGAIFKLNALAAAKGISVNDLLATIPTNGDGGYEFAFGKLRHGLTEEQQAALQSGPKNLGQFVSASHRPEGVGPDSEGPAAAGLEKAREKFAAHESNGHGPPESVPAQGRR